MREVLREKSSKDKIYNFSRGMFLHRETTYRQEKRKAGRIKVRWDSEKETTIKARGPEKSLNTIKAGTLFLLTVVFVTPSVYPLIYIF